MKLLKLGAKRIFGSSHPIASGLVALLLGGPNAHANFIVNGSFEADPFTANGNYELGLIGNDVTGWFIPDGNGTYPWGLQDGAFGASTPYGNQWIVLGYWATPTEYTIQQTMTGLTPGAEYKLSFAIASESGCCSEAEVSFLDGSSTGAQTFSATPSGNYWTDWSIQTMNFIATDSSVTLQFKNINPTNPDGIDLGLDNVSVELVPIPAAVWLFGSGLLGLIGVARRKKAG